MRVAQFKPIYLLRSRITRLLHKTENILYRMSAKIGQEQTLYLAEAQIASWLCGQPWVQNCYWTTEIGLVQRFLYETAILKINPTLDVKQVIQQILLGEYLHNRWRKRLTCFQPYQLASMITVQGNEIFTAAYQQQQGVILAHYHAYAAYLVWPWLIGSGAKPEMTVGARAQADQKLENIYSSATPQFFQARQLYEAKDCLQRGGIVRILPDGFQGGEGIPMPFYQRIRSFRTSFAELALLTGATVLPVSAALDLHGKVEIIFHPPLVVGDNSEPRSQRIEQLIKQYVAFLQAEWAKAPSNIKMNYMGRYLKYSTPITQEGV